MRTVFGNWGVVGQPADGGPRGAWINDNNGYIGDVSPLIGVEVVTKDTAGNVVTFHSVVVPPVDRPMLGGNEESPVGKFWGFEPVSGYLNETQERIAMSTDPTTWPPYWPDKTADLSDPGWPGSWNGYFGKDLQNIQQESYYIMDDANDEEFNFAQYNAHGVSFKPSTIDPEMTGLGLEVKVRGMQWQQFLAQDCIFWLYEVTNKSTTDYNKATFGMLVGTYVGVTGEADNGEYDDDWSFFDVNDDITYTGDFDNNADRNPKWVGDVGMVGYAFLESPGNPFDGIDNDGDYDSYEGWAYAPLFEEEEFDSTIINIDDEVILIDANYERVTYTIPDQDTVIVQTNNHTITLIPGVTKLVEGNSISLSQGREGVNPNAYDGYDNDLDGLIDENYYLHYRQRRVDQNGVILFDAVNPRAHVDYFTGIGITNDLIDEQRNDGIDNDGDWDPEYDDVGADGISGTQDYGENDGTPTPGEPNFDETDVDESDQVGLTSFDYFTPAGDYPMRYDEQLWDRFRPGFFDTPSSIQAGVPIAGEDGDFIYGSGFFPLRAGQTERFSVALVYGRDLDELIDNKRTVQNIYNNNYRFPPPPIKPTLTTVTGNGQVTLYWNRIAETSVDPITKKKDFQGYKIYRATDANFNDVRNVTNAHGIIEGYSPIAQFDLDDDLEGYFYPSEMLYQETQGYSFYLGDNSGLQHSFVDNDVVNGRTYYYALIAYDSGEADKDIFPAENTKLISVLPSSETITDINTAVVTPTTKAAGYALDSTIPISKVSSIATGSLSVEIVDETQLTGHEYEITFVDQATDGIDNDNDWNPATDDVGTDGIANTNDSDGTELNGHADPGEPKVDKVDPDEYTSVTTYYSVKDLNTISYVFTPNDTLMVDIPYSNLILESISVTNSVGNTIPVSDYIVDTNFGRIRGADSNALDNDEHTISFQHYSVSNNPYMHQSTWRNENKTPYVSETKDAKVFDGVRLNFENDWSINSIDSLTYWWTTNDQSNWEKNNSDSTYFFTTGLQSFPPTLIPKKFPSDYIIVFSDDLSFGTSSLLPSLDDGEPTNFKIFNTTDDTEVKYIVLETNDSRPGVLDHLDVLYFFDEDYADSTEFHYGWSLTFTLRQSHLDSAVFDFGTGDTLFVSMSKPFRQGDTYRFTTPIPEIDNYSIKPDMKEIKVVPNPYFAAHEFEAALAPGITSGRGEREIYFTNVPQDGTVHIFTARGQHLKSINPTLDLHDGTVTWNLKTKENLDVAYGVYFYIVESPTGGKKSGKFAVIK
ncbi:MAG: hypothetical protein HQ509_03685 [Candidatus Marinimicrobia bacterium]|nr:hypothetical protein [Candidatus Neomarinimicrobiota bacterium]